MHTPANSIFSSPITNLLSILCVLMKILSHANAKKKKKMVEDIALLLVVFKWNRGSERVKINVLYHCRSTSKPKNSRKPSCIELNPSSPVSEHLTVSCPAATFPGSSEMNLFVFHSPTNIKKIHREEIQSKHRFFLGMWLRCDLLGESGAETWELTINSIFFRWLRRRDSITH